MAESQSSTPDPSDMDMAEHERTYRLFVTATKLVVLGAAATLIFLAVTTL